MDVVQYGQVPFLCIRKIKLVYSYWWPRGVETLQTHNDMCTTLDTVYNIYIYICIGIKIYVSTEIVSILKFSAIL